jgi:hypothetical protein
MSKLKVIWIDDKHDELHAIKESAIINDIELIAITNATDAILELEKKISEYDAIILDGIFFIDDKQSGEASSEKPLQKVVLALERLSSRKNLPRFILTGQPAIKNKSKEESEIYDTIEIFDKLEQNDVLKLWDRIKEETNDTKNRKLKSDYTRAFKFCNDNFIGKDAETKLLNALLIMESNTTDNIENQFNTIRKILESYFLYMNKIGLLPDEVIKQNGWLNSSSKFLCRKNDSYEFIKPILKPVEENILFHLMLIVQDATHKEGSLKLEVDNYISNKKTPYLYQSSIILFVDLLVGLEDLPSEINPELYFKKLNVSDYPMKTIEIDDKENYHADEFLLAKYFIVSSGYKVGDQIKILECEVNTNKITKAKYPLFAKKIERIN